MDSGSFRVKYPAASKEAGSQDQHPEVKEVGPKPQVRGIFPVTRCPQAP